MSPNKMPIPAKMKIGELHMNPIKNKPMKIAFIEFTKSHEECIYTQIKFLKDGGHNITLIIHPELKNRTTAYHQLINEIKTYNFDSSTFFIKRLNQLFNLYKFLINNKFDRIIYNSASSKKEIIILNLLISQNKIKSYGTIHNLKKINTSISQKIISKNLKKYFVINDYLLQSYDIENKNITLESYYPIYFPNYTSVKFKKNKESIWICIPGELDYNRRDYSLIINAAEKLKSNTVKFIILGKVNKTNVKVQQFFNEIKSKSIQDKFIVFNSFIDNDTFHSYIKASDYIFTPLITQNDTYFKYKITGAFNLAFAYAKPLICDKKFISIDDLKENSHFYTSEKELVNIIKQIAERSIIKKDNYLHKKWNYQYQKEKYLNFISD